MPFVMAAAVLKWFRNPLATFANIWDNFCRIAPIFRFWLIWKHRNRHNRTAPVNVFDPELVSVGNGTYGGLEVYSYGSPMAKLLIGNYVSIGPHVKFLLSGEHRTDTATTYPFHAYDPVSPQCEDICRGPIIVGDDVWIGTGAMILSALSLVFFFRFRGRGIVLPVAAWLLAAWGIFNGIVPPEVKELELRFEGLPAELDGYRIVQISDLHASSAARAWRTRKVVELANARNPDLICLTGDYADGRVAAVREELAPLAGLRAKDGVWAVTGNHEGFGPFAEWQAWYDSWGIRFLSNECVFPRRGLALGGVDDFRLSMQRGMPDVGTAFAAATNGEFRILLQHQPRNAHANIEGHGVRLQLSGHTHGGIMPGFRPIVRRHNAGFVRGLYELPHGVLYVNSGCGQWPGFPIRFFTPSEIVLVTLRRTGGQ